MPAPGLLSELIGDIYEASYQPGYWPVVIEKLCRMTSSQAGGLIIQDMSVKEAAAFYPFGWGECMLNDYARHGHHDPAFVIMRDKAVGETVNIQYTSRHELESPDYYEEIRLKHDLGYLAGAKVIDNEVQVVGLGLHRSFSATAYDNATLQLVSELIPHLQRALRIHREFIRLRAEKSALSAGFDSLMMGLMLLDHLGMPAYVNPVAQSILESHPAIGLVNDTLVVTRKEDAMRLHQLILSCLAPSSEADSIKGGVLGLHHTERPHPLVVMVKPVATDELANLVDGVPIYAALYMSESDRPLPISAEAIAQIYGLTRTESQIALTLTNGMSVEEIAELHSRSINTVRTQLKSIFQKTCTGSQADLIRLLLTGVMPI